MGKKSRAKKNKRKEKEEKKTKKKTSKKHIKKTKIFGGVLALIMLALLITVAYLVFQRAFRATPIAKYLPAEQTVAFASLNTDFNHKQLTNAISLLKDHEDLNKDQVIAYFEEKYLIDYSNDIQPWLGRQVGTALLYSNENTLSQLYFAEVYSHANAQKYFADNTDKQTYAEHTIYFNNQGRYITIIHDHAFISEDEIILKELIDFQSSGEQRLYDQQDYRRVDDNLPFSKLAYLYIDFTKVRGSFFEYFPIFGENQITINQIQPVMKFFSTEGIAIIAQEDKFAAQSFIGLSPENIEDNIYFAHKSKYQGELTSYIPENALAFWGGINLEYQLKRILELLSNGEKPVISEFDSLLETYTKKYLGPEINFEQDVLPLFANEYAFAIEKIDDTNVFKVVFDLEDPEKDTVLLHEIADNFAEIGAVFQPKVVTHTLDDGTTTKEIIAVPEKIQKKETTHNGNTIYEMNIGRDIDWGIFFTIEDNRAIVATHREGIISSLDALKGSTKSLKASEKYESLFTPILQSSDELTYFNLNELIAILAPDQELPQIVQDIEAFASGKNYFYDGIVTINYMTLK